MSFLFLAFKPSAQNLRPTRQDTLKGSITNERAWWNVLYYDITVHPDFDDRTIKGSNSITYRVMSSEHSNELQLDLQEPLRIDSVTCKRQRLATSKEENVWFIVTPHQQKGSINTITVYYSGRPKQSRNPPWDGGISWEKDSLGRPWISLGCQLVGASVWFPCKDHQSEEPDNGASLNIVVPGCPEPKRKLRRSFP